MKKTMYIIPFVAYALSASGQQGTTPLAILDKPGELSPAWEQPLDLEYINTPNQADAYPWISYDGLRVYYTKEDSLGEEAIFVTKRKSLYTDFERSSKVPFTCNGDLVSAWLTKDELSMYFVSQEHDADAGGVVGSLFVTKRTVKNAEFGEPERIELIGLSSMFISGCSLTESLEELFLFTHQDGRHNILSFKLDGEHRYTVHDTLASLPDGLIHPGQLSKDGLRFFASIDFPLTQQSGLFQYSRSSLHDSFNQVEPCFPMLDHIDLSTVQPSTSANEEVMVCVKAKTSWSQNELAVSYGNKPLFTPIESVNAESSFSLFPNPASTNINITVKQFMAPATITIYGIEGKLVRAGQIMQEPVAQVDLSTLNAGVYLCKLTFNDGTALVKRFTVLP
jgi:hypothetical protein